MMYIKLKEDHQAGELVPISDDSVYVYCDVCEGYHQIKDTSYAAFGVCSFEELNACEKCSEEFHEKEEQEARKRAREVFCKAMGINQNMKIKLVKK